jgi:ferredoxin
LDGRRGGHGGRRDRRRDRPRDPRSYGLCLPPAHGHPGLDGDIPRLRSSRIDAVRLRLRVHPVACDGYGYCAELLPEIIDVDEWGYPLLGSDPIPKHLMSLAQRAVRDCPRRALFVERLCS